MSHSVAQIRAGRTPNPDMLCNSRVKFGAFLDQLEARGALVPLPQTSQQTQQQQQTQPFVPQSQQQSQTSQPPPQQNSQAEESEVLRFDRVASGHYARVVRTDSQQQPRVSSGAQASILENSDSSAHASTSENSTSQSSSSEVRLALSADAVKDQSYFLAQLSPRQLSRVMFPLGGLTKPQVCLSACECVFGSEISERLCDPTLSSVLVSCHKLLFLSVARPEEDLNHTLTHSNKHTGAPAGCVCWPGHTSTQGQPGHLLPGQGECVH